MKGSLPFYLKGLVRYFDKEVLTELQSLAAANLDITDSRVVNSMFSQWVQQDTKLDVGGADLTPEAFLLAASITANTGTLKEVRFQDYRFKAYFQRAVAELVKSNSIENFQFAFYPEDGLDTLAISTRSPSILSIGFHYCHGKYSRCG